MAGKTVAEAMAELAADPAYRELRRKQDEERRVRHEALARAEAPLVAALNGAGVPVSSVWDLVNTAEPYPQAIATLLAHLDGDYPDKVREGILRALAVPEARVGWDKLLHVFATEPPTIDISGVRFAAALALAAAADDSVMADIVRIVGDPSCGIDRVALLPALQRSSRRDAIELVDALRADPVLGREVKRRKPGRRASGRQKPAR
jgi:small ligand-binding sensory domain FIST